jgi:hypothetical protein
MSEPVESKIRTIPCSPGLCADEGAEVIELEIGGNDAARFTPQGYADGDNRSDDRECHVRRRDEQPVGCHRVTIPEPRARVVTVFPQIELSNLVALPIFKNSSHGQFAASSRANQIDRNVSAGNCRA